MNISVHGIKIHMSVESKSFHVLFATSRRRMGEPSIVVLESVEQSSTLRLYGFI